MTVTAGNVLVHVLGWGSLGMVFVVSIWMLLPERQPEAGVGDDEVAADRHAPPRAPDDTVP